MLYKKLTIIITILALFLVYIPTASAESTKKNKEDYSLGEHFWDWLTTLGKSPEDKQKIIKRHRIERIRKRKEKKERKEQERIRKINEAKKEKEMRTQQARMEKQRKKIEAKKR